MAFSRSDKAWPYMARLTAGYQQAHRPSDLVFRRVGRLLDSCDDADIEKLVIAANLTNAMLEGAIASGWKVSGAFWSESDTGGGGVRVSIDAEWTAGGRVPEIRTRAVLRRAVFSEHVYELNDLLQNARVAVDQGDDAFLSLELGYLPQLLELFCTGEEYAGVAWGR